MIADAPFLQQCRRDKVRKIQSVAREQGWLENAADIPEEVELATHFQPKLQRRATSPLEQHRELVTSLIEKSIFSLDSRHLFR